MRKETLAPKGGGRQSSPTPSPTYREPEREIERERERVCGECQASEKSSTYLSVTSFACVHIRRRKSL